MEIKEFADLHCHPQMRSFNWLRNSKYENDTKLKTKYFHPWFIVYSKPGAIKRGERASKYSQSDLIKITNGNLKIVFSSLYPMEKGWFQKKPTTTKFLIRLWHKLLYGNKYQRTGLRDIIQSAYMSLPLRRINFFQSRGYNYFEELIKEKDFLLSKNNQRTKGEIFLNTFFRRLFINKKKFNGNKEFDATGTYEIASDGSDINRIILEGKTAFIFTIEGANVFNTNEDLSKIIDNIRDVKEWKINAGSPDEKRLPVLFINFAHHFNNYLCGHCRSIPRIGKIFIDQSEGLNKDFTDKGKIIIRYLLGLDNDNDIDPGSGKRILIDVKHMSAKSRDSFYKDIIRPCRQKGDIIPVIASHCGYTGKKYLSELIEYADLEKYEDSFYTPAKPFNTWSINLCDEDILEIFISGGIIGVNLDQRILAMPLKNWLKKYPHNYDISFLWRNLKAMMDAVIRSERSDIPAKDKVVNLFGLGSDFDGYINPLNKYPTVLQFSEVAEDLIAEIELDSRKVEYLFGLTPTQFVKKLCFENAKDFAIRNL